MAEKKSRFFGRKKPTMQFFDANGKRLDPRGLGRVVEDPVAEGLYPHIDPVTGRLVKGPEDTGQ